MSFEHSEIDAGTLAEVNSATYLPPVADEAASAVRAQLSVPAVEQALAVLLRRWCGETFPVFVHRLPPEQDGVMVRVTGWLPQEGFEPGEWGILAEVVGRWTSGSILGNQFPSIALRLPLMAGVISTPAGSQVPIRHIAAAGAVEFSEIDPQFRVTGQLPIELRIVQAECSFSTSEADPEYGFNAAETEAWNALVPGIVEKALQKLLEERTGVEWCSRLDEYRTGFALHLCGAGGADDPAVREFSFELSGGSFSPEPFRSEFSALAGNLPSGPVTVTFPGGSTIVFSRLATVGKMEFARKMVWGRERLSGTLELVARVSIPASVAVAADLPENPADPHIPETDFKLLEDALNQLAVKLAGMDDMLEIGPSAALFNGEEWGFLFRNHVFDEEHRVLTLTFDCGTRQFERRDILEFLTRLESCFPVWDLTLTLADGSSLDVAAILKEQGECVALSRGDTPAYSGKFGLAMKIICE